MSFPQPSAPASRSVRIPVTSSTTPLGPPDCPSTSHSDIPGDEDQFASWVHFAKSQRALGESVPSTLIFNPSNGITGSLRRRRAPRAGPLNISEVPDASVASQEEMEPIIDDDRPSPLIRALTPKQRLVQVKRSLKMAQVRFIPQFVQGSIDLDSWLLLIPRCLANFHHRPYIKITFA
jgi:hypothetical protein